MSAMKNYARPYLTLPFYLTCERLLDEAEALTASDAKSRLHVRRERIPVDAGLYCMWPELTRELPAGQKPPLDRETLLKRYEQCRLEQLVAMRTPAGVEKGSKELAEELAKLKEPLPIKKRKP